MVEVFNRNQLNDIILKYAEQVAKLVRIDAIYLFGSYARGTADKDSDIDLLVVSPDFTDNVIADSVLLMKARWDIELRIEPHPVLRSEFEDNPLIYSIKNEMQKVI